MLGHRHLGFIFFNVFYINYYTKVRKYYVNTYINVIKNLNKSVSVSVIIVVVKIRVTYQDQTD